MHSFCPLVGVEAIKFNRMAEAGRPVQWWFDCWMTTCQVSKIGWVSRAHLSTLLLFPS